MDLLNFSRENPKYALFPFSLGSFTPEILFNLMEGSHLQAVKNVLSQMLDTVVQSSGWLDSTIDKAISDMDNVDKLFSSHLLKEAVLEIQDKHKTSEVHLELFTYYASQLIYVSSFNSSSFFNCIETVNVVMVM